VLSDEPVDSAWSGARGLVTDVIASVTGIESFRAGDQGYVCGPPAMVDAAVASLSRMGMAKAQIFFDKFLDASTRNIAADGPA
jgi:p-cymene monooxygenase electron transfer component